MKPEALEYHPRGLHLSTKDKRLVLKAEQDFPFNTEGAKLSIELDAQGNPAGTEYDLQGKPIKAK